MRSPRFSRAVALSLALAAVLALAGAGGVRNGDVHDGKAVDCDVPMPLRIRNTVGTDGAGLCVWASLQMTANYLNIEELSGLFEYMQTQRGGGWPERVDQMMKRFAPDRKYKQYQGSGLDFIEEGIRSGRPVCVTYGYGELYGMKTIAHWVICVELDAENAAILDNNDPGHIWWMPREEFRKRFTWPGGSGWALYFLTPPPPPPPHN